MLNLFLLMFVIAYVMSLLHLVTDNRENIPLKGPYVAKVQNSVQVYTWHKCKV